MPTTYPFDPTGTLVSNKITGEQHIITPVNYKDYHFIVPRLAPFFANSLQITFRDTDNNDITLVEGVDWYLSHWFISASRACSKPIYGSISILNRDLSGVLTLRYQTLGGTWNIDEDLIAQILADRIHNPRTTSWDSVSEMPYSFPVIDHEWDLVDMVGMSDVVDSLDKIRDALLATSEGNVEQHILNYNNPHQTTAGQVGAYSINETNTLLLGKLGTGDRAFDSFRFNGLIYQQVLDDILSRTIHDSSHLEGQTLDDIKSDFISSTVANSEKFGGMTPGEFANQILIESTTAAQQVIRASYERPNFDEFGNEIIYVVDRVWTPLSRAIIKESDQTEYRDETLQFFVFGGESEESNKGVGYLVNIVVDPQNGPDCFVYGLNTFINDALFGFTTETDIDGRITVVLWIETNFNRSMVTVTSLTSSLTLLIKDNDVNSDVLTEPPSDIIIKNPEIANFLTFMDFNSFINDDYSEFKNEFQDLVDQLTDTFNDLNNP